MPTGTAREAECTVCSQWPLALRVTMRCAVGVLPLRQPVCARCLQAFWINITAAKGRAKSAGGLLFGMLIDVLLISALVASLSG